ncbi:thioesterase [Thauera butanivorans]|uniref:thioesterase n=1 Tax=Thauera butanivorans TaxID=86174 RepID=UPI000839179F|nr:thioesterase [Thauera butanivorans]
MSIAFQDFYAEKVSHCHGCGRNNPAGHHLKSYWAGDETIAKFLPKPEYSDGVPHHVHGGLIASLLDYHGIKGTLRSMEGRKVWVDLTLSADGEVCATGEMLAVRYQQ